MNLCVSFRQHLKFFITFLAQSRTTHVLCLAKGAQFESYISSYTAVQDNSVQSFQEKIHTEGVKEHQTYEAQIQ